MVRRKGGRRPRGLLSGFMAVCLSATLALPQTIGAQTRPGGVEAPLTERERSLLERIQNLEKELAGLRDVQARLAAVEALLGEGRTKEASKGSADSATSASAPGS